MRPPNKLMKKLIWIIILSLYLITPSQADDIQDFQIEGMSIGDSMLNYFSKENINKSVKINPQYPKDDFKIAWFNKQKNGNKFKIYDGVTYYFKKNDSQYLIYGMLASIYFPNNLSNCLREKKIIQSEIENALKVKFSSDIKQKLFKDDTTMMYGAIHNFTSGGVIQIVCYDWSKNKEESEGRSDELSVSITNSEYSSWIDSISDLY